MLKELSKRLPFMQGSGKRVKVREEPDPPEDRTIPEDVSPDGAWDGEPLPDSGEASAGPEESLPEPPSPEEERAGLGEQALKAGLAACREKDYPAALESFLRAAELGSREAQFLCGQMYQRGIAADPDDKQALNWYKRAAKQGLLHAQMACGAMYEEGRGTKMDLKRALSWYEQAARQGNVKAQLKCGAMYSCGRAETRNPKKARCWLETAAEGGSQEARRILDERF